MGRNLTNLPISASFQYLAQVSGSENDVTDGLGVDIDSLNVDITGTATTASYVAGANVDGTVATATSASYATTASLALALEGGVSLQSVLDTGNTATEDINLTGDINATNVTASFQGDLEGNADTATTASHATIAEDLVSTARINITDITASAASFTSASIGYLQTITGSAKIIGDAFIILNNDTPTERYAGLVVQDSGSTANTASLLFDGQTNDWFYQYTDDGGATDEFGVVMFGPGYNTQGAHVYPADNAILKGTGDHHIVTSSMVDDGTLVTINANVSASGYVSASEFIGDGSKLTGVDAFPYTGSAGISGSLEVNGNVIFGHPENIASATGVVLGGGSGGADKNESNGTQTVVAGGHNNVVGTIEYGAIIGGKDSSVSSHYGGAFAGRNHTVSGQYGVSFGGTFNTVSGQSAAILGGQSNTAASTYGAIVGGLSHTNNGPYSVIVGGSGHSIATGGHDRNGMLGGQSNTITSGNSSATIGGYLNDVQASTAVVVGGRSNLVSGQDSVVAGGDSHVASGTRSGVFAGWDSNATGDQSAVLGGGANTAAGAFSAIVGGENNNQSGTYGTIIGAEGSTNNGNYCNIFGAYGSTINGGDTTTLVGGYQNTINGNRTTIIGGYSHDIASGATNSAILGGEDHSVVTNHTGSVIIGGYQLSTQKSNEVVVPDLSVYGETFISSSALGTGSFIDNLGQEAIVTGSQVQHIVNLSQTEYDALTPDSNTLYVIDGAETLGDTVVSGSLVGEVGALSIASTTASMDCSAGNYFTLTLANGVDTHLDVSNIQAGQTINLKLTNNATAAGTISFASEFEFEGGTAFTATAATNAVDILTFVSFDGTSLQTVGVKNFS